MKHKLLSSLIAGTAALLAAFSAQAQQQVFLETYEAYDSSQYATYLSLSPPTQTTPIVTTNDKNKTVGGSLSGLLDNSLDGVRRTLPSAYTNKTWKMSYWGYDDMGAQGRWYANFQSAAITQIFGAGRFSSAMGAQSGEFAGEGNIATKYQGRVFRGDNNGWFNLINAADRSNGWHKFEIIFYDNNTPVGQHGGIAEFYVDGVLGRKVTGVSNAPLNMVQVSSVGGGTTAGGAWFDDIKIVVDQPYILTHPTPVTINEGQSLNVSVTSVGPNLTYQWQRNGTNILNATDATYSVGSAQVSQSGTYRVVVSNAADSVTSTSVSVTVNPLIFFHTHPQSQYVNLGENATFTASATSPIGSVSYQWQKNGTNILNGTGSTLVVGPLSTNDAAIYTVVATDGVNPPSTSQQATLYVNKAPVLNLVNGTSPVGSNFVYTPTVADDYSALGVMLMDFEDYTNDTPEVLFRAPGFSGTTSGFVGTTSTNFSRVSTNLPAGNLSQKALHVRWNFVAGWIRLTTASATGRPNPIIPFNQKLKFDMYGDHPWGMGVVAGMRETGSTGAIGANGGTSGAVQWVGAYDTAPTPVKPLLVPSTWTSYEFYPPDHNSTNAQVFSMPGGNGDTNLFSASGKGTLEHLALVISDGYGQDHSIYIDNVCVVPTNNLTFSLDSAPAGAQIDPVSGKIRYTPMSAGAYTFSVRAADHLGMQSVQTFTLNAGAATPPGPVLIAKSGANVVLTWSGSFVLQSSTNVATGYQDVPGNPASGYTVPATDAARFYRLRN